MLGVMCSLALGNVVFVANTIGRNLGVLVASKLWGGVWWVGRNVLVGWVTYETMFARCPGGGVRVGGSG